MASITDYLREIARERLSGVVGGAVGETKSVTSGILVPSSPYRKAFFRKWTTEKAIKDGYDANEWVKTCVDRIALPASSVPWRVSKFKSAEAKRRFAHEIKGVPAEDKSVFVREAKSHQLEPLPDHPLEKLIEEPNPFFDRQGTIERMTQHLLLGGNSILTKVRGSRNGVPLELWIMPPDEIEVIPDHAKFIKRYEVREGDGEKRPLRPEDVIHLMLPDPSNLYWGMSVLKSAAMVIDTDVEAVKWNKVSLENRAAPDGVFAIQEEIAPDQFEEQRRQLRVQYQGRDNARTPLLIGNQAKYYQLSLSPVEMDFLNSRKMNRQGICSVFNVHPAVAGAEFPNYAAMKEINRDHWVSTIIPYLDRVQAVFNRQLAREFGNDLYCWYDTSNVEALRENYHEKVRSAALLGRMGYSPKALNRRLDLGFTEDECEGLEWGLIPASTRSVKEIIDQLNNPTLTDGNGAPNSLPDGGEVIDVPAEAEPVAALEPAGDDSNKSYWSFEEAEAFIQELGIKATVTEWDNHFVYDLNPDLLGEEASAAVLSLEMVTPHGVRLSEDRKSIYFYQGEADQRTREAAQWAEQQRRKWREEGRR